MSWIEGSSHNGILWVHGKPGIGKSVITAQIIEHLDSKVDSKVLYYFFNKGSSSRRPLDEVLRLFLSQLISKSPELATYLLESFTNTGQLPSNRNIKSFLEAAMLSALPLTMITDGLDECYPEDQKDVLEVLLKLQSEHELKLMIGLFPERLDDLYAQILGHVCGNGRSHHQQKAVRILQWLIAAKRPMRRAEIESAIVLDGNITEITGETKLKGDPLELCAPLLEADEGGSELVGLVHFTAAECLTNRASITYFRSFPVNYTAVLACVLYFVSGLRLVTDTISTNDVVQGYHDLCVYAADYWYEHLLRLSESISDQQQSSLSFTDLREAIRNLAERYGSLTEATTDLDIDGLETSETKRVMSCLGLHESSAWLMKLAYVSRVSPQSSQKTVILSEPTSTILERSSSAIEGSVLHRMKSNYGCIVEQLLSDSEVAKSLDQETLNEFRKRRGTDPFACRYRECHRNYLGFKSFELRNAHELNHVTELQCKFESCPMFEFPFKNSEALRKHYNKYHTENKGTTKSKSVGLDYQLIQDVPSPNLSFLKPEIRSDFGSPGLQWAETSTEDFKYRWPQHYQEGDDWFFYSNPTRKPNIKIELVANVTLDSSIISFKFSANGEFYVVSGLNSAYVYEFSSGHLVSTLTYEEKAGNYIRDVTFTADGRYLITAAGDKLIKVKISIETSSCVPNSCRFGIIAKADCIKLWKATKWKFIAFHLTQIRTFWYRVAETIL
ncbi:MAG: hypothetical protein Q9167_003171 [Letrouitia subvulpina]